MTGWAARRKLAGSEMEEVLESTRWVAEQSEQVRIDGEALERFAGELAAAELPIPRWNSRYHLYDGGERTVFYLLILDSLNFCFWAPKGKAKWEIDYGGERLSGYFALAAALKRALEEGVPLNDPEYLARLSPEELGEILDGRGKLQLLEQRCRVLNELGEVLLARYEGRAHRLVEGAAGSAVELARLLAKEFSSFRDVAEYKGKRIYLYKRAQILAADLWGAFQGQSWGSFADIGRLTAFADYKLPQILRHLGVLRYAPELAQRIDRHEVLQAGSPEEVELRANTVWAVELLRRALVHRGKNLISVELDWLLWGLGQREEFKERPHHRTVTIFY